MNKRLRRLKTLKQTLKKPKSEYTLNDIIYNGKDNLYKLFAILTEYETGEAENDEELEQILFTRHKDLFKTKATATRFINYFCKVKENTEARGLL